MTLDIINKRKRAYECIWRLVENSVLFWDPPIDSDRRLAQVLAKSAKEDDITRLETDIISLKEGKINPSQELVSGVKRFFEKYLSEDRIDSQLVEPFSTMLQG